ncbi:Uncharacterised protein [Sphingobacterium daejeonense]|nr:Uncharacterised protein [Sphingobacterium daejeonense]
MNRRNSRNSSSRSDNSGNKTSAEDIYQLGYSHGFRDASK